jgi:hypothetical protein
MPSSSATVSTFQPELVCPENTGQFDRIVPLFFASDGGWDGRPTPDNSAGLSDWTGIEGSTLLVSSSTLLPAYGNDTFTSLALGMTGIRQSGCLSNPTSPLLTEQPLRCWPR